MNKLLCLILPLLFLIGTVVAQEQEESDGKELSEYTVGLSFSAFGPSLGLAYNFSKKTSLQVAFGAFSGDAPFEQEIAGHTFKGTGGTTWMGFFLNHRPIENANWFRLITGIGIGGIENEIVDVNDANHSYTARYSNNPVGYLGVGFGGRAVKGFQIGFDIGALFTAGPQVMSTGSTLDADVLDAIPNTLFFGKVLPNAQLSVSYGF